MECWNGEILSCEKGVCVIECHHTLTKTNQINCACVRHLEVVISIAREYFRDQLIISWFFVHKYLLHIGLDETNQAVCPSVFCLRKAGGRDICKITNQHGQC